MQFFVVLQEKVSDQRDKIIKFLKLDQTLYANMEVITECQNCLLARPAPIMSAYSYIILSIRNR